MKLALVSMGLIAVLFGLSFGHAARLLDDAEITAKLCPKNVCLSHWNTTNEMICNNADGNVPPGKDYVFDAFLNGNAPCFCPCNFAKFYP